MLNVITLLYCKCTCAMMCVEVISVPTARTKANRKYNEKAYDRLAITIPKGQKAAIQRAADAVGESINAYTQKALLARMGLDGWDAESTPDQE